LGSNHARLESIHEDKPIGRYTRWWPNHQLSATWMQTFSSSMTNEMVATETRDYSDGVTGVVTRSAGATTSAPGTTAPASNPLQC
jgi:hypothetical protein